MIAARVGMSDRQKNAKAKKQNNLEGLEDARGGKISRLDQFEVGIPPTHKLLIRLTNILENHKILR